MSDFLGLDPSLLQHLLRSRFPIVVVETPLYDGRSAAVLAEARRLVPGKPIRTVINSHHHFDHSGGLRTAVAEGAQGEGAQVLQPSGASGPWPTWRIPMPRRRAGKNICRRRGPA